MGSARYPHRTQRGPRKFIGGDGVWSATDCSGRFPATWSGHRRCCAFPTSTSRDSSQDGTSSSRSTWYETVICADCARRQPFRVRQARQSPPTAHAALRGPLQGVGARRKVICARLRNLSRQRQYRSFQARFRRPDDADRGCQTSPLRSSTYRRGDEIWPPRPTHGTLYSPLTGAGGGSVAEWPTGQSLFLMSHPDVSLVNILLSITGVSLVQNKCVFCQLRVHYSNQIKFKFMFFSSCKPKFFAVRHIHYIRLSTLQIVVFFG